MISFPEKAFSNPTIQPPKKKELIVLRALISLGLVFFLIFVLWFFKAEHIGYKPLYYLLTGALVFRLIKIIHEWYHYWGISAPAIPERTREWTVDMLTTFVPGEPYEMTVKTLEAMVAVTYPHTTYLCDEGDDPYLKKVCKDLGVVHVTRELKVNAKAGNINNALKQATGEITIILDPDHIPAPNFIDRVLPYFEDDKIGYAQCVQAYYNQNESLIAKAAAEQTYSFYGPMMMSMNSYGTAQAIGANCAFRRAALDSIGGHAAGLSEDMHTAMQLHSKGWKSVYVPEALSRGLAPATLSAFYKQQLKWSRGTFELLFVSFPKLVRGFTFRQIIHYLTIPLYFLYGLIGLIDIAIPISSMLMAEVPWNMELGELLLFAAPLGFVSILIRQYSQRWLLEESERGFHLLGGILLAGTWWVFLLGFIYTIFRVKVPYIPTPKEGESENAFNLSLPNITVILLSIFAIIYGLSIDYTPYTFMMATFATFNIFILGSLVIISQQKFVRDIRYKYNLKKPTDRIRGIWWNFRHGVIYPFFRQRAGILIVVFMALAGWYIVDTALMDPDYASQKYAKNVKGFYVGVDLSETAVQFASMTDSFSPQISYQNFQIIALDHYDAYLNPAVIDSVIRNGSIPMLVWSKLPEGNLDETFRDILNGGYDSFLEEYSHMLNRFKVPVFVTIDIHQEGESSETTGRQELFVKAWEYIYQKLDKSTATKIGWVWKVKPESFDAPQPYHRYIDWYNLDVAGLNDTSSLSVSLSRLDSMIEHSSLFTYRPILLSGINDNIFSSFTSNQELSHDILDANPRIRGWIFYPNQPAIYPSEKALLEDSLFSVVKTDSYSQTSSSPQTISGRSGYSLKTPLGFIRGVNYNLESDWRDGHAPLTRRQLEADFEAIKSMGANTIRRYAPSHYDRNLLQISGEYDLNVLYGFDFDPRIDFRTDQEAKNKYLAQVQRSVGGHADQKSITAWVLGDDTWNELANHFSQPYLEVVRQGYIDFLNELSLEIHRLDPSRPVIAPFTVDHEFNSAYQDYSVASEIDVIGINVFDDIYIDSWYSLVEKDSTARPWVLTAFGPQSHANRATTPMTSAAQPIEPTPEVKSQQYVDKWKRITKNPSRLFQGGLAFCWRDRMDGSLTWYGLTDSKGRKKRSYRALSNLWTEQQVESSLQNIVILSPSEPLEPGGWHEFRAISPANNLEGTHISWSLMPEGQLREVGKIFRQNEGQIGKIGFPRKPGLYRIYVYQYTDSGDVITASLPIQVGSSEEAPEESWWEVLLNLIR